MQPRAEPSPQVDSNGESVSHGKRRVETGFEADEFGAVVPLVVPSGDNLDPSAADYRKSQGFETRWLLTSAGAPEPFRRLFNCRSATSHRDSIPTGA